MEFLNAYKRLEKLCSDMYGTAHGISAYIEDMVNCPQGARLVSGWQQDLRQLKHYRWVRNKIVHEPDCTEEELCTPADARWLDTFYDRIMGRKDPLAMYCAAVRSAQDHTPSQQQGQPPSRPSRSSQFSQVLLYGGIAVGVVLVILAVLLFIFQGSLDLF